MKAQTVFSFFNLGISRIRRCPGRVFFPVALLVAGMTLLQGCGTVSRQVSITSEPPGATVRVDGAVRGTTPLTLTDKLEWSEKKLPSHTIKVDKLPEYASQTRELTYSDAVAGKNSEPLSVSFDLALLKKEFMVDLGCNVLGATVMVNNQEIGVTPMRQPFIFTRTSSSSPWSTFTVVVKKDGYSGPIPPGTPITGNEQPFTKTLTFDDAVIGKLNAELVPVRFVRSPITQLVPTSRGMTVVTIDPLSQVGEIENEIKVGKATKMTDLAPENATYESRVSLVPDASRFAFSLPVTGSSAGGKTNAYFNLWMRAGTEQTRLTEAPQIDIEACVSPDGQWLYFSSDRLQPGKQNIWRMQTAGRGGFTKITDSPSSRVDTYPSVSPDGKKLVFTSFLDGVEVPQIWIVNSDGTLPTQIRSGKLPSWSPDGEHIAFVQADNSGHDKIWVMGADGGNPTQLTTGDFTELYPVWTPDSKRIVYASNQGLSEAGEHNFDIWIMKADGTQSTS